MTFTLNRNKRSKKQDPLPRAPILRGVPALRQLGKHLIDVTFNIHGIFRQSETEQNPIEENGRHLGMPGLRDGQGEGLAGFPASAA